MVTLAAPYTPPLEAEPGKTDTASAPVVDKENIIDGKSAEKSEDNSLTGQHDFSSRIAYIPSMADVMARRAAPQEDADHYPGRVPLEAEVLHAADWDSVDFATLPPPRKPIFITVARAFGRWALCRSRFGDTIGESTFESGGLSLDSILRAWEVMYQSVQGAEG